SSRCRGGRRQRRQARDDFRFPLNHLRRLAGPGIKHRLDRSDGLLDLLIAHLLDRVGMLQLHFPRHQERANLHVCRGLLLTHLFNRGRPMLLEVGSEREQEILVERSTRSLQGAARVSYADHVAFYKAATAAAEWNSQRSSSRSRGPALTASTGSTEDRTPTHGCEPTREAAMAAFAPSWLT